ncbi:energy transducer TonB [Aureibacter tunicatorum]|uniref:TonB family protein n=1 Tax=Aureibacter tunicatorum TaxID=866807 RepID=A0AAE3XP94_9BACT|nr:energy transducer TonB [Aureibacter tunicatorum]MDR6240602.1 TonB family protein [Aureibacter tunicatorum]BDD06537.1 hypothetical protein AUTU_40200 [Aureibacter tunicatorum]
MAKIKNISLKFPCLERYDDMKLQNDGRFCDSCEKLVYDFTDKTLEDLEQIKKENKGSVCGRFKKSQLNSSFYKYAAATVIAASSLAIDAEAQVNPQNKNDTLNSSEEILLGDIENFSDVDIEIEGEITECVDTTYVIVDKMPEYLDGGMKGLNQIISEEIKYPSDLKKGGRVFIEFVIGRDGNIYDPRVLKGLSTEADKEALRVISNKNIKFIPGEQRGQKVPVRMVLPIVFTKRD